MDLKPLIAALSTIMAFLLMKFDGSDERLADEQVFTPPLSLVLALLGVAVRQGASLPRALSVVGGLLPGPYGLRMVRVAGAVLAFGIIASDAYRDDHAPAGSPCPQHAGPGHSDDNRQAVGADRTVHSAGLRPDWSHPLHCGFRGWDVLRIWSSYGHSFPQVDDLAPLVHMYLTRRPRRTGTGTVKGTGCRIPQERSFAGAGKTRKGKGENDDILTADCDGFPSADQAGRRSIGAGYDTVCCRCRFRAVAKNKTAFQPVHDGLVRSNQSGYGFWSACPACAAERGAG